MTLIVDNSQPAAAQTHALLIGVGKYPHLPGGDGPATARDLGLGQLTSPPVSARQLAEWLGQEYNNPNAPLGSLELLLSEGNPAPFNRPGGMGDLQVEPASLPNVRSAFDRWLDRCAAHPENRAVFYFCGHGASIGGDPVLLLEDYGQSSRSPFRGAIDLIRMVQGVAGVVAGHKCFFIDACSDVAVDDLDVLDSDAEGFLPTLTPNDNWKRMTVIRAAVDGSSAYGTKNEASRFTRALIACLAGRGARKIQGSWVVTNQTITEPLSRVMAWINSAEKGRAQVHSAEKNAGETILHVCKTPPIVPVEIGFDPPDAIEDAELTLTLFGNSTWQRRRAAQSGRWIVEQVSPGFYQLDARFKTRPFRAISQFLIDVSPPGPEPADPIQLEGIQ